MPILAMRLYGPLAAWGTEAAGAEQRPTAGYPGPSAVLGLLGAAMGRTRDQALDGMGDIRVAVASHGRRDLVTDFHTVETIANQARRKDAWTSRRHALLHGTTKTMITKRQYLADGLWRVFIHGPQDILSQARDALRRPRFELYLGRRSCPLALPPDPMLFDEGGLVEALDAYPAVPDVDRKTLPELHRFMGAIERRIMKGTSELTWEDGFPGAPVAQEQRQHWGRPESRQAWTFRRQAENWALLTPLSPGTTVKPIDFFGEA